MEKLSSGSIIENPLDSVKEDRSQSSFLGNPIEDPNAAKAISHVVYYPITAKVQDGATGANYGYIFVADRPYEVISITERHRTKGSDSGATLQVEKLTTGTAKGAGVNLLSTAIAIGSGSSNDTTYYGTLTNTKTALILRKGDAIGLVNAGTLTSLVDVCVTIILRAI